MNIKIGLLIRSFFVEMIFDFCSRGFDIIYTIRKCVGASKRERNSLVIFTKGDAVNGLSWILVIESKELELLLINTFLPYLDFTKL